MSSNRTYPSARGVTQFGALVLGASLGVVALTGPGLAQAPDYDFYKGKTVDIMVANAAGTTMGNTFAAMHDALEKALGASVRINYNTSPTVAALNAGTSQEADGLHIGAMAVGTAQANAIYGTGLNFDLTKLDWIGASYGDMNAVWACGATPQWKSWDDFMASNDHLRVTAVFGGSSYLINLTLLKALNRDYSMLTGYTSKDIGISCTRGDANWKVSAAGNYVNSAGDALVPGAYPLILSGPAPKGSPMKFLNDMAPTLADWVKTYKTTSDDQKKLLDLAVGLFATDAPNEALYAPAGTPPERLAALREAFAKAVQDPAVQEAWLKIGLPPGEVFIGDDITAFLKTTVSDLPAIRNLLEIKPKNP